MTNASVTSSSSARRARAPRRCWPSCGRGWATIPQTELRVAAEEQRKITRLRLDEAAGVSMSGITTHVLDTARGRPAAGVPVVLESSDGEGWRELGARRDRRRRPRPPAAAGGAALARASTASPSRSATTSAARGSKASIPRPRSSSTCATRRPALPRAAAAQPVTATRPTGGAEHARYADRKQLRQIRPSGWYGAPRAERNELKDVTVAIRFEGDFAAAYTDGDNEGVLPTDTMKNTVYALAAEHPFEDVEDFGLALTDHLLQTCPRASSVRVDLVEHLGSRIEADGPRTLTPSAERAARDAPRW